MVRIGHAVGDENGKGRGGAAGDQTGKEIRVQNFYVRDGGWKYYLEPPTIEIGNRAAHYMLSICSSPQFGYDRDQRWTGYDAIKAKGVYYAKKSEFDCSSLVLSCYRFAGLLQLREKWGSTSTMVDQLKACGFKVYTDTKHTTKPEYMRAGGVLVTPGHHTAMVLDDGGKITPMENKVKVIGGAVNIRTKPKTGDVVKIAYKGEKYELLGVDATGWYKLDCGYISNREDLTEVI